MSKSYSTTLPSAQAAAFDAKVKAAKITSAEGLREAVTLWLAPVPLPPVPVPTVRQKVYLWMPLTDVDKEGSAGAFATLKANNVAGLTCIARTLENGIASWEPNEWANAVTAGLDCAPGFYAIMGPNAPQPFAALADDTGWAALRSVVSEYVSKAQSAGCKRAALDLENYDGAPGNYFDSHSGNVAADRAAMKARATTLGQIYAPLDEILIYTSSNVSAPGTYQDEVEVNAGNGHLYTSDLFPDFVAGLVAGGAKVTVLDSVFASGVQLPGRTWESGIRESVMLAHQVFVPSVKASVMLWPDNDESHGPFAPAEIQTAVEAATRLCDGTGVVYEHHIADGTEVAQWGQYLAAIKAATV